MNALVKDWRNAPLRAPDRALCKLAEKLTLRQRKMSPDDLEKLRDHGFDDRSIHDAVQIIAYFNYITRIADALEVEPEDFIQPWGQSGLQI
ncbi:hypothetical protein ACFLZW_00350 [Chloroflexota bacterium]